MELAQQRLVENLLDWDLLALAPGDCDSRIQVVYLGRSQSHCLQVLLAPRLDLQLGELLFLPGNTIDDPTEKLQSPDATY